MSELNRKNCSGCKKSKDLNNFYKNKLSADGHSNYCTECTKENSKKYFQKKKERLLKNETDELLKLSALSKISQPNISENTENLIRLMKIENLLKTATYELNVFKNNFEKTKDLVTI